MRIHLDHSVRADDEGHSHLMWAAITNMLRSRRPLRKQNLRQIPIMNSTLLFQATKFAAPVGGRGQKRVCCRTVFDRRISTEEASSSVRGTRFPPRLSFCSLRHCTVRRRRRRTERTHFLSPPIPAATALSSHNTESSSHLLHISHGGIALMSDHAGWVTAALHCYSM